MTKREGGVVLAWPTFSPKHGVLTGHVFRVERYRNDAHGFNIATGLQCAVYPAMLGDVPLLCSRTLDSFLRVAKNAYFGLHTSYPLGTDLSFNMAWTFSSACLIGILHLAIFSNTVF